MTRAFRLTTPSIVSLADLDHWTAHALRRTAVSNMAELINHRRVRKAGVTLSVYAHYDYAREKVEALDLRSQRIDALGRGGAKIVPILKA